MRCTRRQVTAWLAALSTCTCLLLLTILYQGSNWAPLEAVRPYSQIPVESHPNTTGFSAPDRHDDLTVVTAYLNIGTFDKGSISNKFTPNQYAQWTKVFAHIRNPVVAYFDTEESAQHMQRIRATLPANLTHIVRIHREELRSFTQYLKPISDIFKRSGYPRHLPNTVVPEYSCVMHAKYELMNRTVHLNPFNTTYFSWIDLGLFRTLSNHDIEDFKLTLPPKFNTSKVAYTRVNKRTPGLTSKLITIQNQVWVCGCFFLGTGPLLTRLADMYFQEVDAMLAEGWMSTDQQVLYSLYNRQKAPRVELQTYVSDGRFNNWFHLGYICRDAWLKANRTSQYVIRL